METFSDSPTSLSALPSAGFVDDYEAVDAVVVVDVRVKGADGKLYPPLMPIPLAERKRLRALEHDMRCRRGMSIRQVQAAMLAQGIRRSRGQIHKDMAWQCPYCVRRPPAPPDPAQRIQVHQWR